MDEFEEIKLTWRDGLVAAIAYFLLVLMLEVS